MVSTIGQKFWRTISPVVFKRKKRNFERLNGLRIGIDATSWIRDANNHMRTLSKAAMGMCDGYYEPTELIETFLRRHEILLRYDIKPTYVFTGQSRHPAMAPPLDSIRNAARQMIDLIAQRRALCEDVDFHKGSGDTSRYPRQFAALARVSDLIDPKLPTCIAHALVELGVPASSIICAPFLSRYQLVSLELDGHTDASWSDNDAHYIALGSRKLVLGASCADRESLLYDRGIDLKENICPHRLLYDHRATHMGVATVMYGCDYMHRVKMLSFRPKKIFRDSLGDYIQAEQDGTLDLLMGDKWRMTRFQIEQFRRAVNMFRYCPVLRLLKSSSSSPPSVSEPPVNAVSKEEDGTNKNAQNDETEQTSDSESSERQEEPQPDHGHLDEDNKSQQQHEDPQQQHEQPQQLELVPLRALPRSKSWKDMIGFDPASELSVEPTEYAAASHFLHPLGFHHTKPSNLEGLVHPMYYHDVTPVFDDRTGRDFVRGKVTNKRKPGGKLMRQYVSRMTGKSIEEINDRARKIKGPHVKKPVVTSVLVSVPGSAGKVTLDTTYESNQTALQRSKR